MLRNIDFSEFINSNQSEIGGNKVINLEILDFIGSGGTWMAYKCRLKEEDGVSDYAVLKEYYPIQNSYDVNYVRDTSNNMLKICAETNETRLKEKEKQKDNVDRELKINQILRKKNNNNNPYMFREWICSKYGDSTYVLVDTADGKTLKELIYDNERKNLTQRQRINHAFYYTRKILKVLDYMFCNEYIHGDLKPENIYIAGEGEAENIYFLDFGSVFSKSEYCVDINSASDSIKIEMANKILNNDGLGTSSDGYCSPDMVVLRDAKKQYKSINGSAIKAKKLLKVINSLDVSVDIYSILKIFYLMITGNVYKGSNNTVEIDLGDCGIINAELIRIMQKNESKGYHSIEEITYELDVMEALLNKTAHPKTLLYGLKDQVVIKEIDERLFGEIISD